MFSKLERSPIKTRSTNMSKTGDTIPISEDFKYPSSLTPQGKTWEYGAQQTIDWEKSCHRVVVKKVDASHANKHLEKLHSLFTKNEETWDNLFDSLTSMGEETAPFLKHSKEVTNAYLEACALASNIDPKSSSSNKANSNSFNSYQQQLPKIHVPIFEGQPEKWSNYWTAFESIVHNR